MQPGRGGRPSCRRVKRDPDGRPGGSPGPCGFPPEPRRPPSVLCGRARGRGAARGRRAAVPAAMPLRAGLALQWSLRVSLSPALTFTRSTWVAASAELAEIGAGIQDAQQGSCPQRCASREPSEAEVSSPSLERPRAVGRWLSSCPTPLSLSNRGCRGAGGSSAASRSPAALSSGDSLAVRCRQTRWNRWCPAAFGRPRCGSASRTHGWEERALPAGGWLRPPGASTLTTGTGSGAPMPGNGPGSCRAPAWKRCRRVRRAKGTEPGPRRRWARCSSW